MHGLSRMDYLDSGVEQLKIDINNYAESPLFFCLGKILRCAELSLALYNSRIKVSFNCSVRM